MISILSAYDIFARDAAAGPGLQRGLKAAGEKSPTNPFFSGASRAVTWLMFMMVYI